MQVDRIRSFETDSADPARPRGNGRSQGFSELMDSVLGPAAGERSARPEAANARGEKSGSERPSRDLREATVGPRKAKRGDDRETARADDAAAKPEASAREEEGVETTVRGEGDEREDESSAGRASGLESELVGAPVVAMPESLAPLGIPVFEGLGRGSEAGAVADETITALASDLALGDDGRPMVGSGALPAQEAGELAEAASGRMAIADPRAREALRAAIEEALVASEGKPAALEGEGDPIAAGAPEFESSSALQGVPQRDGGVARADTAPGAAFAAAYRAAAADANGGRAQADLGGDDSSRGRDAAPAPTLAGPAPQRTADSSAVAAAAVEGATAGLVEAISAADEGAAPVRLDAAAAPGVARALELPPAMQTARALPSAAPEAIAVQAEWLATRGGGTARLVLNPPELGEIAIRVTVRQQAVEVVLVAQTALAHSMAEDQGDRLSQAFASRDLRLDQFEVRRGDPSDANGTGQFGSSDAGARERERAQDERGFDRQGVGGRGAGRGAGSGEEVAGRPPRIASNGNAAGNAAGIDLRI